MRPKVLLKTGLLILLMAIFLSWVVFRLISNPDWMIAASATITGLMALGVVSIAVSAIWAVGIRIRARKSRAEPVLIAD